MIVLSLQSGTSADGIDVAVVEFVHGTGPGTLRLTPLHTETVDWDPALRARILAVAAGEALDAGAWTRLTTELGQAFAEAAARGIRAAGVQPDLVVSHGQTVYHWVEGGHARGTLQLGEPAWIAERTGAPVLSDLRMADIAAGGEGAPLMAFFDRLWLGAEARATGRPIATVNLGGIANVQLVAADGSVAAFDTGPGNCLIDAVVDRATGGAQRYDDGGRLAAAGQVHEELLTALLAHPYFAAPAPKSTGRETFDLAVVDAAIAAGAGAGDRAPTVEDLAATLTELTARTVVDALADASAEAAPATLICSGGGAQNPALLARIADHAAARGIEVESSAERGLDPGFKESLMFALLGYCSLHGAPIELGPSPAGGRVLGRFSPGRGPLELPTPHAGAVASVTIEHRTNAHRTNGGATP